MLSNSRQIPPKRLRYQAYCKYSLVQNSSYHKDDFRTIFYLCCPKLFITLSQNLQMMADSGTERERNLQMVSS